MAPADTIPHTQLRTGKGEVYFLPQIAGLTLPEADYGEPATNGEKGTWRCKILAPSREAHDAAQENAVDTVILVKGFFDRLSYF
jgi:hypothetical protein